MLVSDKHMAFGHFKVSNLCTKPSGYCLLKIQRQRKEEPKFDRSYATFRFRRGFNVYNTILLLGKAEGGRVYMYTCIN